MSADELLNVLATAGVQITREGDNLRVRAKSSVDLAPYVQHIQVHKPTLVIALLQSEIVTAATAARDAFDRSRFDELWRRWHALNMGDTPCEPDKHSFGTRTHQPNTFTIRTDFLRPTPSRPGPRRTNGDAP